MSLAVQSPCDGTAIRHGAEAAPCAETARRWVLVAAILASSMAFIDGTVVNVALPVLQRELHASAFDAQWVVEAYALMLAALLLVGGWLGDRFGRRRVFALGVAIFGIASIGCALSRTIGPLIAARAVQGIGAALLVPGSLALISASFPENERGRAIGTWSGFSGITAALGPVLGGWLVDHVSWSWAFLINLPLCAAVLAITLTRVPESRDPKAAQARLDWPGALCVTLGLAGVVYAFTEAPARQWRAPVVWIALLLGVVACAAFVAIERRRPDPMLPLRLFDNRNFAGTNLLTLLLYAALGGGLYFLPLNLIQVHHQSAAAAGAALLPFIAIMFALSRWAGRLVERHGPRRPLIAGPLIAALGFALLALPGASGSYWRTFFPGIVVLGFGMTVTVAPLTTTVMGAAGAESAGLASGINNAVSRVAAVLAIAVFGALMAWAFARRLDAALQALQVPPELAAALHGQLDRLAALEVPAQVDPALAARLRGAVGDAFVAGFRAIMVACALLALASAALAARFVTDARPPAH